ncbi:hypothetical protein MASR2M69_06840 [Bacteroidota bacterium]
MIIIIKSFIKQLFENSLFLNVLGGFIVAILTSIYIIVKNNIIGFKFKRLIGFNINKYVIVYSELKYENRTSEGNNFVFTKEGINQPFSSSFIIPSCESRAANYLNILFYKSLGKSVGLVTDASIKTTTSLPYCSIGGMNNYKSVEIIESLSNQFLSLERNSIIYNKSRIEDRFEFSSKYDLCAIIKIKAQGNTKICVSGLGNGEHQEVLVFINKWKELKKYVKNKEFGAIVRVKHFSDDSAELIYVVNGKLKLIKYKHSIYLKI